MASPDQAAAIPSINQRAEELARAWQRVLRQRPTALQRAAIRRASLLSARAEIAAADASISLNDLVRLDGAAQRARSKLHDLIGPPVRRPPRLRRRAPAESAADVLARYLPREPTP